MLPINSDDISALITTLELSAITTLLLLIIGLPLAWWLARTSLWIKYPIQAIIALPLVLPPTVLGFYLLIFLSAQGILAPFYRFFDMAPFAFSFTGLVIGSMVYSLPFVIQPLYVNFRSISSNYLNLATTLGAKPLDRFVTIVLPLSKNGILMATVLGFAHTVGEFGIILMIGGNIPDKTRVLSIAIYDHVESLQYANAHVISALLMVFSLITLMIIFRLQANKAHV